MEHCIHELDILRDDVDAIFPLGRGEKCAEVTI